MTAPDYPYRPHAIEPGVQKYWDDNRCFEVTEDPAREKFYCLSMLPYPSGRLHMGHVRNYTIGDVISRYQRMRGRNVLQPMGWDAFGLPAENAAIERRMPPAQWTYANIESMKTQLKRLGFAYDWSRELATCTPEYYKWEQWFFNRLLEKNLAYKKMAVVNWDPVEQTVLANEQVENGRGWRSGAVVERREVSQWFIRITDYAEELLADIDKLDGWPESVKTMQRNWIGRSEGVEFAFAIEGGDGDGGGDGGDDGDSDSGDGGDGAGDGALSRHPRSPRLKHCGGDVLSGGGDKNQTRLGVYTTRPDTLMGITAVFVAGEHPLAVAAARTDPAVAAFVAECRNATTAEAELETLEKRGVPLNRFARHPVSGERVPLWAANFVLLGYGTGAVMAVPAHDQRDWEFAVKHGIEVRPVIAPPDGQAHDFGAGAFTGKDGTLINSGEFDGLDFPAACAAIADHLERAGAGQRAVKYRLRDWGVSRQRYWGCPIPVVYDDADRAHAVADDDLPVVLPEDVAFSGVQSPLKDHAEFMRAKLPGGAAESATRETDTFDTFVESSWYFHRYCCPGANAMLDARADYWLPVDQYVGGIEHAVLHLLYARFFHKLLRDAGLVASDEPFTNLLTQGMVLKDGAKMSKSKGNTVDPQAMIDKYGADTVRLFVMFAAPPDQALEWNDAAVAGAHRFLRRWWQLAARYCVGDGDVGDGDGDNPVAAAQATLANPDWAASIDDRDALQLRRRVHAMLDKAARDYRKFRYNTVIAACMELLNAMEKFAPDAGAQHAAVFREGLLALTKTLAPITPHIAHRLWRDLGEPGDVIDAAWPVADLDALAGDSLQLVVQVNGKLRARIEVAADADEDAIQAAALADARVRKYTDGDGKTIAKVIVVPKRLVNVVVRDG